MSGLDGSGECIIHLSDHFFSLFVDAGKIALVLARLLHPSRAGNHNLFRGKAMKKRTHGCARVALALGCLLLAACYEVEGGSNLHEQKAGNNEVGGIDLGGSESGQYGWGTSVNESGKEVETWHPDYSQIAVDPSGRYLLTRVGPYLVYGDLLDGHLEFIEGIRDPHRVAFAKSRPVFYVTSASSDEVMAFGATSRCRIWRAGTGLHSDDPDLYPSPKDDRLVLSSRFAVTVMDAHVGARVDHLTQGDAVVDVDFTPDGKQIMVTLDHNWLGDTPHTPIRVYKAGNASLLGIVDVPNCASRLTLTPGGSRAFLAPTDCVPPSPPPSAGSSGGQITSYDPVSVIDVAARTFMRNLPGFGPVAMASNGVTAVAFLNTNVMDASLFDDPAQIPPVSGPQYYVMLIDTRDLSFGLVPIGDRLPRYALTPDGKVVLVDFDTNVWGDGQRIRVLDVTTRSLEDVSGSNVQLDHFAIHPDGRDVYLVYGTMLYHLSIPARAVRWIPTDLWLSTLNITPDGQKLLLLDHKGALHVFDTTTETLERTMTESIDLEEGEEPGTQ
jgi:hypothetical protein